MALQQRGPRTPGVTHDDGDGTEADGGARAEMRTANGEACHIGIRRVGIRTVVIVVTVTDSVVGVCEREGTIFSPIEPTGWTL